MTLPRKEKLALVGNYRLTGKSLGQGNFAKVEEGVHKVLKTKVALKIMNLAEITEDYVIKNLYREAKLMSKLSHPYISALFETIQSDTRYILVTELVSGGDLCSFMKTQRGGRLEERSVRAFGRQIVSAVAYMHSEGIIHRDLKMENIILNDAKTHIKIVDFGLSNVWSPGSPLRTHCGSPEYAAPELFVSGQNYGPQVDLWSLGVILYGMIIGTLPFVTPRDNRLHHADKRKTLIGQITRGITSAHRKALSVYSIEFRSLLARLLVPDPTKRLRIQELVRHPWITERNKRPLRITGFRDLEPCWKRIIMNELSKLLHTDTHKIEYDIQTKPYGPVAGMYNVLAYRRMSQMEFACNREDERKLAVSYIPARINVQPPKTHRQKLSEIVQDIKPDIMEMNSSQLRIVGSRTKGENNMRNVVKKSKTHQNTSLQDDYVLNRRTHSAPQQQKYPTVPMNCAERAFKRKSLLQRHQQQQQQQLQHPPSTATRIDNKKISTTTSMRTRATTRTTPYYYGSTRQQQQQQQQHQPPASPRAGQMREFSGNLTRFAGSQPASSLSRDNRDREHSQRQLFNKQMLAGGRHPGAGDFAGNNKNTKMLLNEPIARCIAGYVGKYMNSYCPKLTETLQLRNHKIRKKT